jgi:hypothetical protein
MLRPKQRSSIPQKLTNTLYQSSCILEVDKKPKKKQIKLKKKTPTLEKLNSPKPPKPSKLNQPNTALRIVKNFSFKKPSQEALKTQENPLKRFESPKTFRKQSNLNKSGSPTSFLLHSPGSLRTLHRFSSVSNLRTDSQSSLKYLGLKEDLEINRKIGTGEASLSCKSCLENIVVLNGLASQENFGNIEENLNVCTSIVRDIIVRMKQAGKSNEGVLIEKLWKHLVFTVDNLMDQCREISLKSDESSEASVKVSILDQVVNSFSLDFEETPLIDQSQMKKKVKSIQSRFETLNSIVTNDWKEVNKKYLESLNFSSISSKPRVTHNKLINN